MIAGEIYPTVEFSVDVLKTISVMGCTARSTFFVAQSFLDLHNTALGSFEVV
jgi:hypothetical protein